MLINRIKLQNILSFGPDTQELELKPLNVLIGPNGSGKSNLIEVIGLLKAAPSDFLEPIREGGGIHNWIWRGEPNAASVKVEVILREEHGQALRYKLTFAEKYERFQLIEERLEQENSEEAGHHPVALVEFQEGQAKIKGGFSGDDSERAGDTVMSLNSNQSIFSQLKGPSYPELTDLGNSFENIGLFRECSFGPSAPARQPQKTDLPNDFLMESAQNLGLILNRLMQDASVKERILNALGELYESVTDFFLHVEYGTIQVFLKEGKISVPSTRLSDGTLRYLCLLAILCHPSPPPLVCIEEPELGLHPDILPGLADLLREASERCQLIVTTHSDVLVDKLTDTPESVVVCEKHNGQTQLQRLDSKALAHWLERYSLGDLWTKGELGGNRW